MFLGLRHVGLAAKDPVALATFYRDVLGLKVVGESPAESPAGATLFVSSHPDEEDHEIVFFDNPAFIHTAFKVATLDDLLAWYRRITEQGLPITMALNHGGALAFYFQDPEGHLLEIYWATGVRVRQPYAHPIDLGAPREELLRDVERVREHGAVPVPA
jgi:catechol-2,3-dioxygenase